MTVKSRANPSNVGVLFDLFAVAFLLLISGLPSAFDDLGTRFRNI